MLDGDLKSRVRAGWKKRGGRGGLKWRAWQERMHVSRGIRVMLLEQRWKSWKRVEMKLNR